MFFATLQKCDILGLKESYDNTWIAYTSVQNGIRAGHKYCATCYDGRCHARYPNCINVQMKGELMNVEQIKLAVAAKGNRSALVLQKYSPEILLTAGVVGVVGAAVWACYETWKAKDIIRETQIIIDALEDAEIDMDEGMSVDKAQMMVLLDAATKLLKMYLGPVVLGGLGIAALIQSRNILSRRNAGLVAAYKTLDEAYKKYRKRVQEEFGDDVDNYLRRKQRLDKEFKIVDEEGEEVEFDAALDLTPEEQNMVDFGASQYAKFFDASSPQWRPTNDDNIFFLRAQQTNANVTLKTQGHLLLNEVYDMLGLPRTKAGCVVGWVDGNGENVVDFGIYNSANDYNADFVNGYEREHILLDFNVDGWVWDLI